MSDSPAITPRFHEKQAQLAARLGLLCATLVSIFYLAGFFDDAEEALIDRQQLFSHRIAPDHDLALIDIDHVPSDRPWPWSRLDYALLLRGLIPQSPQSIVFEMLMHDTDARYSTFDETFASQVTRARRVIFAAVALAPDDGAPLPVNFSKLPDPEKVSAWTSYGSFFWPVLTFSQFGQVGLKNLSVEKNETLRRVPLLFRAKKDLGPSLALLAAAQRLGADLSRTTLTLDREIILRNTTGRILRRIPIDGEGCLRLRFRQPDFCALRLSYDDLLLGADQNERDSARPINLGQLQHRQIWIGATDHNVVDPIATIVGPKMPVEIQLQATAQILNQDYIQPVPRLSGTVFFGIVAILLSRLFVTSGILRALAVLFIFSASVTALTLVVFQFFSFAFPLVTFWILTGAIGVSGLAGRFWEMSDPESDDAQMNLNFPHHPPQSLD